MYRVVGRCTHCEWRSYSQQFDERDSALAHMKQWRDNIIGLAMDVTVDTPELFIGYIEEHSTVLRVEKEQR